MRTETTYIAFDDTEFKSKKACLEYEQNLKLDLSSVLMLNENFEVIRLKNLSDLNALDEAISQVFYIKILNAEIAERFFNWIRLTVGMNMDGFPDVLTDGLWLAFDNEENYKWYNPEERMMQYVNMITKLHDVEIEVTT